MKSIKVLLVEDDRKLKNEVLFSLQNTNISVTGCVPYLFNAMAEAEKDRPDIVLLDALITEQSANFISKYLGLPIIVIANQSEDDIERYKNTIHVLDVIHKPVNLFNLNSRINGAYTKAANN